MPTAVPNKTPAIEDPDADARLNGVGFAMKWRELLPCLPGGDIGHYLVSLKEGWKGIKDSIPECLKICGNIHNKSGRRDPPVDAAEVKDKQDYDTVDFNTFTAIK